MFRALVDAIMSEARAQTGETIILGDFNAKAVEWGSPTTDHRGSHITEWIAHLGLVVLNDGIKPTCVTPNGSSHIDITMATSRMARRIRGWTVHDEESLSVHRYITFTLATVHTKNIRDTGKIVNKVDRRIFKETLTRVANQGEVAIEHGSLVAAMKSALQAATAKTRSGAVKVPYWWTLEIDDARKRCISSRRALTRAMARRNGAEILVDISREELRSRKTALKKLIAQSKRNRWRELCDRLEDDIWGDGYRLAVRALKNTTPYSITDTRKEELIRGMFPGRNDVWANGETVDAPPHFTQDELQTAVGKLKLGTAPGLDKLTPECIVDAMAVIPGHILSATNNLLQRQEFPREWKMGRVTLIPKGEDTGEECQSYRPITLLSVVGKLYEALVRNRLVLELEATGGIHPHQYGFREGKSTLLAIERVISSTIRNREKWNVLITLDVKNAFNAVSWGIIIKKLRDRRVSDYIINIVSRYLEDRSIHCGDFAMDVTAGVPQGSVIGPTLWNVAYDDVLRLPTEPGVELTAYADDLAITVAAESIPVLNARIRKTIKDVTEKISQLKLQLAPHKTEAVVLRGPRKREGIRIEVEGTHIQIAKAIKYLGVMIDSQGTFGHHVTYAVKKTERRIAAFNRILPNIGGPGFGKRRILLGVVHSTLLYGAPIWHRVFRIARYHNMMTSAQRKMLLRVASAYRTVSAPAVQVITGTPPIDLLAKERATVWGVPREDLREASVAARRETMVLWQRQWGDVTGRAAWTKRLIPNISAWVECPHRQGGFHMTQFLSGHGSFSSYTHRIGKKESDQCVYCEMTDTPEHTFWECPRWERTRIETWGPLAYELTPDNIVGQMTASAALWRTIADGITAIMKEKEREEREFQALPV